MGRLVILPQSEIALHVTVYHNEYLQYIFLDSQVEVERALQCAYEETHPELESAVQARFYCALLDAVKRRKAFYYLQH